MDTSVKCSNQNTAVLEPSFQLYKLYLNTGDFLLVTCNTSVDERSTQLIKTSANPLRRVLHSPLTSPI